MLGCPHQNLAGSEAGPLGLIRNAPLQHGATGETAASTGCSQDEPTTAAGGAALTGGLPADLRVPLLFLHGTVPGGSSRFLTSSLCFRRWNRRVSGFARQLVRCASLRSRCSDGVGSTGRPHEIWGGRCAASSVRPLGAPKRSFGWTAGFWHRQVHSWSHLPAEVPGPSRVFSK